MFRGDTVAFLYGRLGPFSAADRAAAVEDRLQTLRAQGIRAEDVRVEERGGIFEVWAADLAVMVVTEADAQGLALAQTDAALDYAASVRRALSGGVLSRDVREIAFGIAGSVAATLVLWLALRLLGRGYLRLYRRIRNIQEEKLPSIRFQGLVLLTGPRIERALVALVKAARLALSVLLFGFYAVVVISFFPPTRVVAQRFLALIVQALVDSGLALVAYLPSLVYVALIGVFTFYGLRLMRAVSEAIEHGAIRLPGFYPDWGRPTYQLLRLLVLAFALVLIWPHLPNSDSIAFRGVAAFLGLLVTFGSAGAVSNVVGGVVLIYMRPFQIGDRVRIADTVGDVVARGMLVTRLRTIKHVEITIPNAMVLSSHIINYSTTARDTGVILHTTVTLGYDAPWRAVHEAMTEAARRTEGVLDDPPPFVLQTALGDYAVSYELNAYTRTPGQMAVIYSDLHANLQDACAEAGIEILSPIYHSLRDGNLSTLPEPHSPSPEAAPAFRVRPVGPAERGEVERPSDSAQKTGLRDAGTLPS